MADCKHYYDEMCINADCPYRADYCPVTEYPALCKFYQRQGTSGKSDFVKVVRCSECEYFRNDEYCYLNSEMWHKHYVLKDDYCSYGKRKE